jgi:two-component system, chemotaxis family, response regulator Rcp1
MKILLVEDNDADTHYLKMVLDGMGLTYTMSVLGDGESAIDYLLKRGQYQKVATPDLIFLDLNLPKMSGSEVLAALPATRRFPLCILTGSVYERDKLRKKFGIRRIAYVIKPVTREMVLNCFRCYEHLAPIAEQVTVGNRRDLPTLTAGL